MHSHSPNTVMAVALDLHQLPFSSGRLCFRTPRLPIQFALYYSLPHRACQTEQAVHGQKIGSARRLGSAASFSLQGTAHRLDARLCYVFCRSSPASRRAPPPGHFMADHAHPFVCRRTICLYRRPWPSAHPACPAEPRCRRRAQPPDPHRRPCACGGR